MKEKTVCKALNSEIKITRLCWDHITRGTTNNRRSKSDAHRRINLLKIARKIIFEAESYTTENRNGNIYYTISKRVKLEVSGRHREKLVKVIIKKTQKGEKVLYSIMKK